MPSQHKSKNGCSGFSHSRKDRRKGTEKMKARLPQGVGGGPQNMNAMIRQAQKMQEDMAALQEELDAKTYEITAGGGAVTIKISGKRKYFHSIFLRKSWILKISKRWLIF